MVNATTGSVLDGLDVIFNHQGLIGLADDQLLERVRAQDATASRAFGLLLRRHGAMVWQTCRGVLGDAHEADDAFQAAFLILARRAGSIRVGESGSLGPWLHGVARRVASDAHRRRIRRQRRETSRSERARAEGGHACSDDPATDLARDESTRIIHEEVARLPDRLRDVVVLCDLQGLSHREASGRLKVSLGTVKSRQARARDRLRDRLVRRGLGPALAALETIRATTLSKAVPASLIARTAQITWHSLSTTNTLVTVPATVAVLADQGSIMTPWTIKTFVTCTLLMSTTLAGSTSRDPAGSPVVTMVVTEPVDERPVTASASVLPEPTQDTVPSRRELAEQNRQLRQEIADLRSLVESLEQSMKAQSRPPGGLGGGGFAGDGGEGGFAGDLGGGPTGGQFGMSGAPGGSGFAFPEAGGRFGLGTDVSNTTKTMTTLEATSDDGRLKLTLTNDLGPQYPRMSWAIFVLNNGEETLEDVVLTIRSPMGPVFSLVQPGSAGLIGWEYDQDLHTYSLMNSLRIPSGESRVQLIELKTVHDGGYISFNPESVGFEVRGYGVIGETLETVATPPLTINGRDVAPDLKIRLSRGISDRAMEFPNDEGGPVEYSTATMMGSGGPPRAARLAVEGGEATLKIEVQNRASTPKRRLRVVTTVVGGLTPLEVESNVKSFRTKFDYGSGMMGMGGYGRMGGGSGGAFGGGSGAVSANRKPVESDAAVNLETLAATVSELKSGQVWSSVVRFRVSEPGPAVVRCVLTYEDQPEGEPIRDLAQIIVVPKLEDR